MRRRFRKAALFGTILLGVAILAFLVRAEILSRNVAIDARRTIENGVKSADVPSEWIEVLLAVEDPSFFEHPGVDFRARGQGWTTLTQGLVKRHYPGSLRGPVGKIRQSIFALALNRHLDKTAQLDLYLNTAYFGDAKGGELIGFEAASSELFGRTFDQLSREQFVELVAMLVGPNHFHPLTNPAALNDRVSRINHLLAGKCHAIDWQDVYLEGCAQSLIAGSDQG